MYEIQILNLALMLLPALLVVGLFYYWSATDHEQAKSTSKTALYAIGRMLLQLCLVGYVLAYVFGAQHYAIVLTVLLIMMLIAAWISLRTAPEQRKELYLIALLSIGLVNLCLLAMVSLLVLQVENWYQANVVIPLAGMLFATGMTSISLVLERYQSELSNGVPTAKARSNAFNASLIPSINALFAVGLVSLPGMMTGQILSGVSPLIAARYQIMVMLMLFSSAGLSSALFLVLMAKLKGQIKKGEDQ